MELAIMGRSAEMVGTVVMSRYRIEGPLGTGGSSRVYRALDLTTGASVALKILDPIAAGDPSLRALFLREARALSVLSHPNIVPILGGGETGGLPFIVMELVEGPSLAELIAHGPLPFADAVRIATEIASALAFAHAQGIVHADLKPSNVLLTQDDTVRVCDFGVARTPREDGETAQLVATARYVAPERVEGKSATPATDVYGLGLVLYEMLVGRPPFTSGQAAVLVRDHLLRTPVPPSHLRPSLPESIDTVIARALAKRPDLRFARMSDFAAALEEAAAPPGAVVMRHPITDFVPRAAGSSVVAFLATYGGPIHGAFFGLLTSLPLAALALLAGTGPLPALIGAGLLVSLALADRLALALALAWVCEVALVFLFVPGFAVLLALMGLWVWLRDIPVERAALALAMPVLAPFGLGPALALTAAILFGIEGVVIAAWGAILTVLVGIAAGQPLFGHFANTGLPLQRDSLFEPADAAKLESALTSLVRSPNDRFEALRSALDPAAVWSQVADVASRVSGADVALVATVFSWTAAALTVWAVTRVLRTLFDATLRERTPALALFALSIGAGVGSGGLLLVLLFMTWAPLATSTAQPSDDSLLAAGTTCALIAFVAGVVLNAIGRRDRTAEES